MMGVVASSLYDFLEPVWQSFYDILDIRLGHCSITAVLSCPKVVRLIFLRLLRLSQMFSVGFRPELLAGHGET